MLRFGLDGYIEGVEGVKDLVGRLGYVAGSAKYATHVVGHVESSNCRERPNLNVANLF